MVVDKPGKKKIIFKSSKTSIHDKGSKTSDMSIDEAAYKVKQKTHEELEIEIQTDRVLYILDQTIEKLRIGAHLGYITDYCGELLLQHLSTKEAQFIIFSCDEYIEQLPASSFVEDENRSASSVKTAESVTARFNERGLLFKDRFDVNLMQCIDILFAYPELIRALEDNEEHPDELSTSMIAAVIELRNIVAVRLSSTAVMEKEMEQKLRNAWKDNNEAKMLIQGLQDRLDKQHDELQDQLDAKDDLIKMYTEKIEAAQQKFKEDIKKRVIASEKSMIQYSQKSEEKQEVLSQDAKEATHNYNTLLEQHLATEKMLRAKRFKVEAQLGGWLEKYDKDIGDRQAELEALQAEYDQEKIEMDALQAKFDEQEEEYLELMAERDEYEEGIFNKRMFAFIMNRSARTIQRAWRAYIERKKARKRAKKDRRKKGKSAPPVEEAPPPEVEVEVSLADLGLPPDDDEPMPGDSSVIILPDHKAEAKKEKGKGKKKEKGKKKDKKDKILERHEDPNAALSGAFTGDVFQDISDAPMPTGDIHVDL